MTRSVVALMVLALSSACKNKPEPVVPSGAAPNAAGPTEWQLTLPLVDGYVRYQRSLLVQAGKLKGPAWDGGLKEFEEPSIEQKATADERARQQAGLTAEDVVKIEAIVSRVAARRLTARMLGMDQKMPDLPLPAADGDGGLAADLAAAVEGQQKLQKAMAELQEEREAFGSQAIDLVLQREDELLKNWSLMMDAPELSKPRR